MACKHRTNRSQLNWHPLAKTTTGTIKHADSVHDNYLSPCVLLSFTYCVVIVSSLSSPSVIDRLCCDLPLALSSPSVINPLPCHCLLSSLPCSVIALCHRHPALSSTPCSVIALCHQPPALSSTPCSVITLSSTPCSVTALSHRPPPLSSLFHRPRAQSLPSVIVPFLCHRLLLSSPSAVSSPSVIVLLCCPCSVTVPCSVLRISSLW